MATKYKLQDAHLLQGRDIFVDTNVLIYLFWPTGQYDYEKNYARVFSFLRKQRNHLFVDIFVISEIINRTLRNEHTKLQPALKFKEFRDSNDGKQTLADIHIIIRERILPEFDLVGKNYSKQDIIDFLVIDDLDFTDKSTASICLENKMVLLTNDKDFRNVDLDIITGNPKILH